MRLRPTLTAVLAAGALGALGGTAALGGSAALAADDSRRGGQSINTKADLTPFEQFTPLDASAACPGEESGPQAEPFLVPEGFEQQVVAEEGDPGTNENTDNWDMSTQNEFGKDAGRYVYRTHENRRGQASQVSLTDLTTGQSEILAERADWEAFDGIVWTPWGTILAAEEVILSAAPDPQVPRAKAGLVYEFFIDRDDPSELDPSREPMTAPGDGTTDTMQDGIRVRPALGAKSHEGMRFDRRGNLYGIAESRGRMTAGQSGGIFRFVPDRKGDLSRGQLQAFDSPNGQDGEGRWIDLDRTQVQIDADREAEMKGANEYQRPEDVETGQSTGKDRNNGGNTLYVALTEGDDEGVLAIDLRKSERPFAYDYVGMQAGNASAPDFDAPDNLALDSLGNLVIAEDTGGTPPGKTMGDDYFVAAPPRGDDDDERGGKRHQPASTVERFASLKDCIGEPSGPYFALAGTERFTDGTVLEGLVDGETLFAHRQHAGQTSPIDQLVAISPDDDDDDDDDDEDDGDS